MLLIGVVHLHKHHALLQIQGYLLGSVINITSFKLQVAEVGQH